ncbi:MAG: diguanylate cyclase [Crocosphaera sp.]|nr:diguanylate cyclase [Crocosphaera sp.]
MNNNFQPIQLLQNVADQGKTGHLTITANEVTWNFYFVEGMLQDASHSLQSLDTIQHYLLRHNKGSIAKFIPKLANNIHSSNLIIPDIFKRLKDKNYLTADEIFMLSTDLIKDAVESYLWLRDGEYNWHNNNDNQSSNQTNFKGDHLLAISTLLETFVIRMKAWKILSHVITSPYQRLFCPNPYLIQQKVPSGNINPTALGKLVKVMEGKTLREISLFLKQDELKVGQLLLPYFENNILKLQPPQTPLDKLPLISRLTKRSQLKKQQVTEKPYINHYLKPQTTQQKTYKIVCIDDSPTILDMIKAYLSSDQFEVITVAQPTQSLPCLFEFKPDLILIDFSMPGINGNKLCRIIKGSSFFKNIPIIMISGNEKMLTPENMETAGATDYLAKPFTKEVLLQMINKYLPINIHINQPSPKKITTNNKSLSMRIPSSNTNPQNIASNSTIQDHVTSLPSQKIFKKALFAAVQEAKNSQSSFSIIFVKMNDIEAIKNTVGQKIADNLLKDISKRLKASIRATDVLARWDNDKFVILFQKMGTTNIMKTISQRMVDTAKQTPLIFEHQLALEITQTTKIYPQDQEDIELLLKESRLNLESIRG